MKTTVATVRLRPDEVEWLRKNFGSLPKGLRAGVELLRKEHRCRIHTYEVTGTEWDQGEQFDRKRCVDCGYETLGAKR